MNRTLLTLATITLLTTQINAELVKTYFDRGQLKAETNYIDGSRTDKRKGIKHGLEKVYYQSGQLAYQVMYVNGKRDGKLEWLDRQGKKLSVCHYKLGKLDGVEKSDIGWGHQIRSYVLAPYQQIKDSRSNQTFSNVNAILDGDLDKLLESVLISQIL